MTRRSHRESGFSLAESLVAVAIIGIMAMVAAPNLQKSIKTSRLNSATLQLLGALREARAAASSMQDPHLLAIDANRRITITNTVDGTTLKGHRNEALPPLYSLVQASGGSGITFNQDGSSAGDTFTLTGDAMSGGTRETRVITVYRCGLSRIMP